jgi:hypothetical protein
MEPMEQLVVPKHLATLQLLTLSVFSTLRKTLLNRGPQLEFSSVPFKLSLQKRNQITAMMVIMVIMVMTTRWWMIMVALMMNQHHKSV